jgi:hypothetical protein
MVEALPISVQLIHVVLVVLNYHGTIYIFLYQTKWRQFSILCVSERFEDSAVRAACVSLRSKCTRITIQLVPRMTHISSPLQSPPLNAV